MKIEFINSVDETKSSTVAGLCMLIIYIFLHFVFLLFLKSLVNFILRVYPEVSRQLQANITSHAFDGKSQPLC